MHTCKLGVCVFGMAVLYFTGSNVCVSFSVESENVWSKTVSSLETCISSSIFSPYSGGNQRKFGCLCQSSFCLLWSINTAEFNHRSVCPSKRSPYVQVLTVCCTQPFWVHHETRHLWMALIFMRQSVCAQSQRGPSLSGLRMYCAEAEGLEGATLRPHTRRDMLSDSRFDNSRQRNCSEWLRCFFSFSLVGLPLRARIDTNRAALNVKPV